MSNIKFFNFNLVTQDTTTTNATSENALFPTENTKDPRTTKGWRSATGTNSASITFDFKTIEAVDSVLIKGDHLQGFGFSTIVIEGNSTSDFSSPAFTNSLLIPNFEFNFGFVTFTAESHRFWRLTISGGGAFVELNNVFIGSFVQMADNNIDFGWTFLDDDLSKIQRNRYNQLFIDKITRQRSINGAKIKLMNKTEVDQLLGIYDFNGTTEPIWVIVDESEIIINDFERFAGPFYMVNKPEIINSAFSLYDTTLNLREVT